MQCLRGNRVLKCNWPGQHAHPPGFHESDTIEELPEAKLAS